MARVKKMSRRPFGGGGENFSFFLFRFCSSSFRLFLNPIGGSELGVEEMERELACV